MMKTIDMIGSGGCCEDIKGGRGWTHIARQSCRSGSYHGILVPIGKDLRRGDTYTGSFRIGSRLHSRLNFPYKTYLIQTFDSIRCQFSLLLGFPLMFYPMTECGVFFVLAGDQTISKSCLEGQQTVKITFPTRLVTSHSTTLTFRSRHSSRSSCSCQGFRCWSACRYGCCQRRNGTIRTFFHRGSTLLDRCSRSIRVIVRINFGS
mmetsp:Transcript_9384/g.14424  ORF Transcript_9384/g.14424 Transcript_9384/m.14424 type:complete len:205 (-) Transcript_9384:441-1055(-)